MHTCGIPVGIPSSFPPRLIPFTTGARKKRGRNAKTDELACVIWPVATMILLKCYVTELGVLWSRRPGSTAKGQIKLLVSHGVVLYFQYLKNKNAFSFQRAESSDSYRSSSHSIIALSLVQETSKLTLFGRRWRVCERNRKRKCCLFESKDHRSESPSLGCRSNYWKVWCEY